MNKQILVVLFLSMFLISFASALEFDNSKKYNSITREVTIKNAFGLGADIGKARLNTPLNVKVGLGYQKVAEFELWAYEDYNDALKQFRFTDMKSKKKINRDYDLKYLTYEDVEVDDYELVCDYDIKILNQTCDTIFIGTHTEKKEIWNKITPADLKKNEQLTIGIFIDVKEGDYVDWIPTIYGVEIPEWASWTEDLNVGLISYYKFDTGLTDELENQDMSVGAGTPTLETGKINDSYNFTASEYLTASSSSFPNSYNDPVTQCAWINRAYDDGADEAIISQSPAVCGDITQRLKIGTDDKLYFNVAKVCSGDDKAVDTDAINLDTWYFVCGTFDGTGNADGIKLYVNGVNKANGTYTDGSANDATGGFFINKADGASNGMFGKIDEVMIYDRALNVSQILVIYNNGTGLGFNTTDPDNPPTITLNSPTVDTNYTTPQTIIFNFTASDDINLTDIKLYVNGDLNQTNASGINNTDYLFNLTLSDGAYIVYGISTDNESQTTTSNNVTIVIDSINPTINITSPNSSYTYLADNETIDLDYTITDTHLDSCWYEYNGTNTTISNCSANTTFQYIDGVKTITVYANDTFGNTNSSSVTWTTLFDTFDVTYDEETYEGLGSTFTADITLSGSDTIDSAYFSYNDTNYTTSIFSSGGSYVLSTTITIPSVTEDTNVSFEFVIVIDGVAYTPEEFNHTILDVSFSNCTAGDSLLTVFLVDEEAQTPLTGTIELNGYITSSTSNTVIDSINLSFTDVTNASICLTPNASFSNFLFFMEARYVADDYAPEFYNIQSANLSTYPQNITFYDLASNDSTEFLIEYRDNNYIVVEGAIVQLLRRYLAEDSYIVVEAPITSSSGTTIVHVDLNTNLYRAIVTKNGELLATFNNIVFKCENELSGQCTQELFGGVDPQNLISVSEIDDFIYTVSQVNETLTVTFSVPSGTPASVNVYLHQIDAFGDDYLCNNTVISSAGSLDCSYNATIGDSIVYLEIRKDGDLMGSKSYFVEEDSALGFLGNNFFIVMVFIISLVGMTLSSPEFMVIITVVTLLLAGSLWLLNGLSFVVGFGSLMWLIVGAGIIIYKLTRQEDR